MPQTSLLVTLIFLVAIATIVPTIIFFRGQPPAVYLNVPEQQQTTAAPAPPSTPPTPNPSPQSQDPSSHQPNLKHVIEAIYDAAMKAQSNVQINNLNNFLWLFPPDDSGVHTARTIPVKFTSEGTTVDVPVFSLLHHQNLCIHDLKIKTSLEIDVPTKPETLNEIQHIKDKKYSVKVKRTKKDNTTIHIHLKSTEPTEMYHRMFEKCQQAL